MNHRQWKKKFKKIHGRNPYTWEDKRKAEKAFIAELPNLSKAVSDFAQNACKAIGRFYKAFGKALIGMGETMIEVGRKVSE